MPGPMSAPNGDRKLTLLTGEQRQKLMASKKLFTGKTAKKRGSPLNG